MSPWPRLHARAGRARGCRRGERARGRLESRQTRAGADVRSVNESERVARVGPVQTELVARGKPRLVPVRRAEAHRQPVTLPHVHVAHLRVPETAARHVMRGRVVAERRLDEGPDELVLPGEPLEVSGHHDQPLDAGEEEAPCRVHAAEHHGLELECDLRARERAPLRGSGSTSRRLRGDRASPRTRGGRRVAHRSRARRGRS
jgi:hypothetical protein